MFEKKWLVGFPRLNNFDPRKPTGAVVECDTYAEAKAAAEKIAEEISADIEEGISEDQVLWPVIVKGSPEMKFPGED